MKDPSFEGFVNARNAPWGLCTLPNVRNEIVSDDYGVLTGAFIEGKVVGPSYTGTGGYYGNNASYDFVQSNNTANGVCSNDQRDPPSNISSAYGFNGITVTIQNIQVADCAANGFNQYSSTFVGPYAEGVFEIKDGDYWTYSNIGVGNTTNPNSTMYDGTVLNGVRYLYKRTLKGVGSSFNPLP